MTRDKVQQNLIYSSKLGYKAGDILPGFTSIDDAFVLGVTGLQHRLRVSPEDGVCGPSTYRAVLADQIAKLRVGRASETEDNRLERAQLVALLTGKKTWTEGITDTPQHWARIEAWITTKIGIDWDWESPYKGKFKWCTTFIAYCYGDMLPLSLRHWCFASTYRLDRMARYQQSAQKQPPPVKPPVGPYHCILELDELSKPSDVATFGGTGPRAGDILTVGDGKPHEGDHGVMVESFDPVKGEFTTIEGNGGGLLPDGSRCGDGVVRATRPLGMPPGQATARFIARRLIRLAPSVILL